METIEQEIRRNAIDPARVTVDEHAPVDNYHWHPLAGTGEALEAELACADAHAAPSSHPALNPGLLNGPHGPQMGANVARNSEEGPILTALSAYEWVRTGEGDRA